MRFARTPGPPRPAAPRVAWAPCRPARAMAIASVGRCCGNKRQQIPIHAVRANARTPTPPGAQRTNARPCATRARARPDPRATRPWVVRQLRARVSFAAFRARQAGRGHPLES